MIDAVFEATVAKIAEQFEEAANRGPLRLIKNLSFRLMWRDYCGPTDECGGDTFKGAVEDFMLNYLHMSPPEVARIWTAEAKDAACKELDRDGNGKVFEASPSEAT
jgi:hypothetical protein